MCKENAVCHFLKTGRASQGRLRHKRHSVFTCHPYVVSMVVETLQAYVRNLSGSHIVGFNFSSLYPY